MWGLARIRFCIPPRDLRKSEKVSETIARERRALAILRNNDDVLQRRRFKHQPITSIGVAREAHPLKTAARDGINKGNPRSYSWGPALQSKTHGQGAWICLVQH